MRSSVLLSLKCDKWVTVTEILCPHTRLPQIHQFNFNTMLKCLQNGLNRNELQIELSIQIFLFRFSWLTAVRLKFTPQKFLQRLQIWGKKTMQTGKKVVSWKSEHGANIDSKWTQISLNCNHGWMHVSWVRSRSSWLLLWPINVRIRRMGGGVLMMIELASSRSGILVFAVSPLFRTGHLHFLVICPHFPATGPRA